MIKYFFVEEMDKNQYSIRFTPFFYNLFHPFFHGDGASYNNIFYKLFGLLPQDFYHYMSANYDVVFIKKTFKMPIMYFTNKDSATAFAQECDRRVKYIYGE